MMMVYFFLLMISIILVASSSVASGVAFLKIDVGARAAGIGGAFVAAGDDISSIWSNPAGLSMIETEEIALHHQDWLQNTRYESIGYAYPTQNLTLGISLNYLSTNHISEILNVNGEPLSTGRLFGASDMSGMFAVSKQVNKIIFIGGGIKYLQEQLDKTTANAAAIDLGFLYAPDNSFRLAISVQNIGSKMQMNKDEFALPLMYRAGVAWKTESSVVGIELNKARGRELSGCAGVELKINDPIIVRCGYQFLNSNDRGSFNGIPDRVSLGFGVKIGGTTMDYAFAPYRVLEDTHRISVSTKFGRQRFVEDRGIRIEGDRNIEIKEDGGIPSDNIVIVTTDNIPLREGPGTTYSTITKIGIGTRLQVVDRQKKWFYEVVLPDGRRGWVCSIFVK